MTGTSGFIGAEIARQATLAGHKVQGLVRATSRTDHLEPWVDRLVVGTHDQDRARDELLEGVDAVIHNSFDWQALRKGDLVAHMKGNMIGSIDLLQAAGDRPFIFMSSVAVHHHIHPRWEGVIDGLHPTRPGSFYGALKAAVEAHMWAAHAERGQAVTSIRPCAVYGIDPDRTRSIGWPIIDQIRGGEAYSRSGGGKFVHVNDVANATIACLDNESASPEIYHLVDCYARWGDWAVMAAELLGVEVDVDLTSPVASKNMFETSNVQSDLEVSLDRGFDGIRKHLAQMISMQDEERSV
ncbi:MAG: NAD(P)-dependent oxidoreductase [Phycisphaerales bacterium]|nr:NAD(P)-dependent oxidoreductase [Phycisphaerales bacterium]